MTHLHKGKRALLMSAALLLLGGCSRDAINYQIAEAIGTVGQYENNEPVESPQMKEQRLQKESEEELTGRISTAISEADELAESCRFSDAIEYLNAQPDEIAHSDQAAAAIEGYRAREEALVSYEGTVPHLCFPTLVEDTMRAFDGDDQSYNYASNMVTTSEFRAILESLYERNYILVDIHDVVREETDDRGVTMLEMQDLRLPSGKKPVIISQDNVNYADVTNGDGIATKLTIDGDGLVKALYTDQDGHDLKGDYDLIPIVDSFVEEHPDFSYKGAKGIISVSGSEGVFGYSITASALTSNEDARETVTRIAETLKENGWLIASAGYAHGYMNEMDEKQLETDMSQWESEVGALVGETDILFYPYGAEVEYPSDQLDWLVNHNYLYLCGLWASEDYMEMGEGYVRQTRRFIDGYTLENAQDYFTDFFQVSSVLNQDR